MSKEYLPGSALPQLTRHWVHQPILGSQGRSYGSPFGSALIVPAVRHKQNNTHKKGNHNIYQQCQGIEQGQSLHDWIPNEQWMIHSEKGKVTCLLQPPWLWPQQRDPPFHVPICQFTTEVWKRVLHPLLALLAGPWRSTTNTGAISQWLQNFQVQSFLKSIPPKKLKNKIKTRGKTPKISKYLNS